MELSNISMFSNVISQFAKENKISRAKLEAFTAAIVASIPQKVSSGRQGRPMLEKTSALHQRIIAECTGKEIDAVTIRHAVGSDPVAFNNALAALIKAGKVIRVGKAKTGKKGRQPFILKAAESVDLPLTAKGE